MGTEHSREEMAFQALMKTPQPNAQPNSLDSTVTAHGPTHGCCCSPNATKHALTAQPAHQSVRKLAKNLEVGWVTDSDPQDQ